ncbi:MFS transporter [Mucilaginibacter sp.]|uniref:MFS transporter n=1 Tax=Mucilaginibacter sp. TaxID=1882438 RepID=UPI003B002DCF
MKNNKNLWVLVFICVINSLGFGIIVPLIYPYGKQFGITEQTLGLLTASFSIAQFFATPVLGSLSDKYGRKPILIISLIGTCISFVLFAEARSIVMLFGARILDGITGGNISVAQAMVSDSSTPEDRAKNFGIIGSAFGFGFVIGPAIGGVLSKISLQAPFWFSAGIALTGVLCCYFFLKETNQEHKRKSGSKFSFKSLITILKKPVVGSAVFIGFLLTTAQFAMIIGFQTFTADTLKITPFQIGVFFAGFGISGILMQLAVPYINKIFTSKSFILLLSLVFCFVAMLLSGFTNQLIFFAGCMCVYGLFNGLRNPMLNAVISERVAENEQGQTLGINQSYASIGQILGPISAGLISGFSVHFVFFLSALFILAGFLYTLILRSKEKTNPI